MKKMINKNKKFTEIRGYSINEQPAAEGKFTVYFTLPAR